MAVPDGVKKPADRKAKKADEVADHYSFDHDGETYHLAPTAEKITPGFLRKSREKSPAEVTFDALELLADEDTLEVLDNLSFPVYKRIMAGFEEHVTDFLGVSLGE